MSHAVFQTALIMPITAQIPTAGYSSKVFLLPPAASARFRKPSLMVVRASSSLSPSPASLNGGGRDMVAHLEQCLASPPADSLPSSSATRPMESGPVMRGGKFGSFGGVTLEKSKLDLSQKQSKSSPELATGGGGGDIGKKINQGGGDGGDDGGDDDDYYDDFDDEEDGDEGGLFRRRIVLQELFDRKFVDAVLNEWQRTIMDLPSGLRQAYEMGLVSSAQMVKFLAINARPTTARAIARSLPQSISRAFIGRMIADPAFLYRLLLEQAATIGTSVWWEVQNRKDRIKEEWDLALINVLTASACNAVVVWSLAPCRSYGNTFRFDLQNTLQKLPNNIFEKSYPLREFDLQKRVHSFFYKATELCLVGMTAGAAQGAISNLCAITVPSVSSNALGYGAFLGIYANLRYQLLCGVDKVLINHFDVISVGLFISTALRLSNVQLGERSRLAWLGIEADPLVNSENLLRAYNRLSEPTSKDSSKWFISKDAIVSGLGLLGIRQSRVNLDEASAPKARRKRIVKKKQGNRTRNCADKSSSDNPSRINGSAIAVIGGAFKAINRRLPLGIIEHGADLKSHNVSASAGVELPVNGAASDDVLVIPDELHLLPHIAEESGEHLLPQIGGAVEPIRREDADADI
ncbi:hypothetical protein V2J09_001965 [Rumex salicifolius]